MSLARMCVAVAALAAAAMPCHADEPLAGRAAMTISHGQPFCASPERLHALIRAQVAHAIGRFAPFPGCQHVPDGVKVQVLEDLAQGSRYMHVVRARAYLLFGPYDAYTYSVGLYPPLFGIQVPPPVAY